MEHVTYRNQNFNLGLFVDYKGKAANYQNKGKNIYSNKNPDRLEASRNTPKTP